MSLSGHGHLLPGVVYLLASKVSSCSATAYVLPGTSSGLWEGALVTRDAGIAMEMVHLAVCIFLTRFLWVLVLFAIEK